MNKSISPNEALVPRHRVIWERDKSEEKIDEKEINWSYAPPDAAFRAKVRHLPIDEKVKEINKDIEIEKENEDRAGKMVSRKAENEIVLKIDAEVTVIGSLPEQGVAIETVTLLRPAKKENGNG